jgi:copper chaperone CopZ
MKKTFVLTAVLLAASIVGFAVEQKKEEQAKEPGKEKRGQQVTLSIDGVECAGCANVLTSALSECGFKIADKLVPNKDGPVQVQATCEGGCDLAACASQVNEAKTPHRAQSPPGLAIVLFSKLNEKSSQEALTACRKIKGVDGAACKADPKTGQIQIKIVAAGQKVTPEQITQALSDAGIQAQLTKATSAK